MRCPPRLAVLAGLTLALAAAPAPAAAITRAEANRIATKALAPAKARGSVVLFGLPRPLRAGSRVFEALPKVMDRDGSLAVRSRGVRRAAWLFWLDRAHGARFQHPSTVLMVDDRTGRTFGRAQLKWWPLVNGRNPAFIGRGYTSPRYQIYRQKLPTGPLTKTVEPPTVAFESRARPRAAPSAVVVPAGAFANDCIVMVGLTQDPSFKNDFAAMREVAGRLGVRVFQPAIKKDPVTKVEDEPGGAELNAEVDRVIKDENCKDVMIYIDGHGFETGPTGVVTGHRWVPKGPPRRGMQRYSGTQKTVSAEDVKAILAEHRDITFKLKVDACFSGRFILDVPLEENPNLLITETSSQANKVSWSFLKGATVKDGESVQSGTPGSQGWISRTNNPGHADPKKGLGEFTNGNLTGMQIFAASQQEVDQARAAGGSLFARMLQRSVDLGRGYDFAQQVGLTESKVVEQINRPQPPPPPAQSACTSLQAALTTYMNQGHVMVLGDCANLLPGLHHIQVDTPAGKQIFGFDAHSPTCNTTLPSSTISCNVKADGRICIILSLQPPAAQGDVMHVSLRRQDDSIISEADHTVGPEQPPCTTGS